MVSAFIIFLFRLTKGIEEKGTLYMTSNQYFTDGCSKFRSVKKITLNYY